MTDKDFEAFMPILRANGAIVLEGVAGIGKTHSIENVRQRLSEPFDLDALRELLNEVIETNKDKPNGKDLTAALKEAHNAKGSDVCRNVDTKVTILVMHPSTSYEEMIGGLRPALSATGSTTFTWQPGKLTRVIAVACKDLRPCGKGRNHLIVLDEINRCNLPSVLGELIYLIEPSRRVTADILGKAKVSPDERAAFREKHTIPLGPDGQNGDLLIPSNLFFLGTMNSSDRSILGFDQALRRRFPPYRLEPMQRDDLLGELGNPARDGPLGKVVWAWAALNVFLRFAIGPDAMVGHSYWFPLRNKPEDQQACDCAWRFGVLPQAIHAVESTRQEAFLSGLFTDADDTFYNQRIESRDEWLAHWQEATLSCEGTQAKDAAEAKAQITKLREAVRDQAHVIRFIGSGHGEKLLITEK